MYTDANDNTEARFPKKKKSFSLFKTIAYGIIALIIVVVVFSSFTVVNEGYTGTRYRLGQLVESDTGTGLQFHLPFVEKISKVDIRAHVFETTMAAYTKDTQVVENLPVKITYMYDRSKLDYIIRNIGIKNVETTLIAPNVPSTSKNFVSKYKGEELTQNRSRLEAEVEDSLRDELGEYGIIITDYNIIDIDFEDNFEENIRLKVAAEVEAQTTKNKTATLEEQARQKVIQAQADADAQKVKADAEAYAIRVVQEQLDKSPQYIELIKAQNWNGELPQVMGNSINPFVTLGDSTDQN